MKKSYFLFLASLFITVAKAQTIDFIDPDFEDVLITSNTIGGVAFNSSGSHMDPDTNNDGHIQVSEAHAVYGLVLDGESTITNFGGIEFFYQPENAQLQLYRSDYHQPDHADKS